MGDSGTITVAALYRYPVKGLSPEPLVQVEVTAGATFPWDRAFAIENGASRFDPDAPRFLPKIAFLMLMRDERLATLETRFDDATGVLTITRGGKQVARGQLTTPIGRTMIEQFMAAFMKDALRGAPKVLSAVDHSFSDVAAKCVHIVNLASVRELEKAVGRPVDPLRFRANIHLDGAPAWAENGWLDRDLAIGDVRLKVIDRTGRCEATNVDPATGVRDMAIPSVLQRTWGHRDFGIYAKIVTGGIIAAGAPLQVLT